MLDRHLLPLQRRLLQPPAQALVSAGISADIVTLVGFILGLLAIPCLAAGAYLPALALIVLNRIADGLDGAVARLSSPSDRGAFLDIALDFFFYATIPLGFAFADPENNALAAAILITTFVGTGSSFLAFATVAAKRGKTTESYTAKGIYYLGGLTEGAETIIVFTLMCLFPAAFPVLATVFAVACMLTTLTRWYQGWISFGETKERK
ncbi:MAG: CDP-alcohol phosphatidyltransferase family protein [Paracoccaceae bacterium]|nr:CDP-alcohol phosphatidyltransferase family protein [Paracoccaceae bacterium]